MSEQGYYKVLGFPVFALNEHSLLLQLCSQDREEFHLGENLSDFLSSLTGFCNQLSKIKTLDNWNLQ